MNKKVIFSLVIVFTISIGIFIFYKNDKTVWITDNDFLYDKAVTYIVNQNTVNGYDKDKNDYKVFADYNGFGIEEKGNKKYVYMWILEESYYVENNKLESSQGISTLYKFTFVNDEVVGYETPEDGSLYTSSMKKMLPDSIENEVFSFEMSDIKLKEQVKEYYSYLESAEGDL